MPVPTDPSKSTSASDEVTQTPRKLVLCFDGTADQYDGDATNVVKLYSLLAKDKVEEQLCYYQSGIGTYFEPGIVTPIINWCAALLDEAIAWYLYQHVMDGYKFLMQNYKVGDKVCLFGFSRGAYTARALAGMLHKVGLLFKDNTEQIPFAYTLYMSTRKRDEALAPGYKKMFCRSVPIDFLGVWDTVASVGIGVPTLPMVSDNTTIKVFRHAVSLDERRAKFRPNLYPREDKKTSGAFKDCDKIDVREVWFSGCHSDVGGGNALNDAEYALSNISLRWMIEQIAHSEASIIFDDDAFAQWNIPTDIKNKPAAGPQGGVTVISDHDISDHDAQDAKQKLTDELWRNPLWWILEILPLSHMYQTPDQEEGKWKWETTWLPNCGRAREVLPGSLVHASVRNRKHNAKLGYEPRAYYNEDSITYVT